MSLDFINAVLRRFDMQRKPFWMNEVRVDIYASAELASLSDAERALLRIEAAVWDFFPFRTKKSRWGTYWGPMRQESYADGSETVYPDIAELDASALACWKARLDQLSHPAMVAHLADVLWELSPKIDPVVTRDFKLGQTAVDAYRQSAAEHLVHVPAFALHRAFDIAMELNDAGRIDAVCEQLLTLSEQAPLKNTGIWSAPSAIFDGKRKISDAHRVRTASGLEARLASAADVPDGSTARVAGDGLLGMYRLGANT